jgi:O-antigen ligase/Flp pilus assembly protein TadD
MTGLFTFFHLLAFFLVLTSVFKKREDWDIILSISIIVGVFLAFYVLGSGGQEMSTRGGGTIGNTSFMGAYLLFDIFFALILFLEKKTSGWRIFSGFSLLVMVPVLLSSKARGAIISFLGGLLLIFLGYLLFSKKKIHKKIGIFLILALMLSVVALAVFQPLFTKQGIETLLKEMKPRFVVWEKGWKGFLEKPILGWGPENFNVVFTKFFNPCVFLGECGGEIWFDRVHNIALDTLVTTGIVGFLSYLLIFVISIVWLLKVYFKDKYNTFSFLGMIALLSVYFFQNLLVFDMISSYTVFFLSLGFVNFLVKEKENEFSQDYEEQEVEPFLLRDSKLSRSLRYSALILIFLLISSLFYFGNLQSINSATNVVNMIVAEDNLEKVMDFYQKALDGPMEKYELREQFSQKLSRSNFSNFGESTEIIKSAFTLAEDQMEESMKKNSLDFRTHLFAGRLYFADYRFSLDTEKLNSSERILEKAIELGPTNQQGYWYLGDVKLTKGEYEKAYEMFQRAIDLEPRLGTSHWYLATVYKITGKYEESLEKIKDADEFGYSWKTNSADLKSAIEVYEILRKDSELVSLYQEILEAQPENAEVWAYLAAAYANLGDNEKAREAAQKVIILDPSLRPRVEQFLKEIEG